MAKDLKDVKKKKNCTFCNDKIDTLDFKDVSKSNVIYQNPAKFFQDVSREHVQNTRECFQMPLKKQEKLLYSVMYLKISFV